jgi:hypothetical protein
MMTLTVLIERVKHKREQLGRRFLTLPRKPRKGLLLVQTFLSVWSAAGPLFGVGLGAYLTMRTQRAHWVADSKKEEYRELISTLTQSSSVILEFHGPMIAHGPEEQRAAHEAQLKALAVISSRLFIAEDVQRLDLTNRWRKAVREIETGGHTPAFARSVGGILADIIKTAREFESRKMWFPNKWQWVVIWLGLVLMSYLVLAGDDDPIILAVFVGIATLLIVWMLEGHRRKS